MPRGGGGDIVVTSRDAAWAEHAVTVPVGVLKRTASAALILERSGQDDGFAASRVAEALGDLPLALQQAAAYMASTGETPAGYLELLREETGEILGTPGPSDYPGSVATAWSISLRTLSAESPDALALLRLLAFWRPTRCHERRSRPDRTRSRSRCDAMTPSAAAHEAVAALTRLALVEVGTGISCHRLIQAVVREG